MDLPDKPSLESYEITFSLTEQDAWTLLESIDNAFPGTPGDPAPAWMRVIIKLLKWSLVTLPIWLLCATVLLTSLTDTPIRMWQVLLVTFLAFIVGVFSTLFLPQRKLHPFVRAFMALDRPQTTVLSKDGVRASADGRTFFAPWTAYSHVELSNGFILLYRYRVADFIPVSAFSSEKQIDEVARFIATCIKEVRCQD